jgi:hypothetical protein
LSINPTPPSPLFPWIQAGSGHGRDSGSPLIVEGIGVTFSQRLFKHCIVTVNVFIEENPSRIIDGYCQIEDIYRYRRLEVSGYGFRAVHCFHYTVARPFSLGIQHKLGEAYQIFNPDTAVAEIAPCSVE